MGNDFIGGGGAIRSTDGTGNGIGHPSVHRFDLKRIALTAATLHFDWYHKKPFELPVENHW